ncbi:hypothetical protein ACI797_06560 [Geodermatophilus sp. SYSU D00691]
MTTRGSAHLQLVTDEVAEPVAVTVAAPAVRASANAFGIAGTTVALAVVLALLGAQDWPLPGRTADGVTDVPSSLVQFLVVCAGLCLWAAGRVTRPARTFRSPAAASVWWAVVAAAAFVSLTAAVSLASWGGFGAHPADLLVRWTVPFVPALLAGVLARRDGRAARLRAALGTGVVTLPLFALGWALLASPAGIPLPASEVLSTTLLAGVAPFAVAVAMVTAERRP